jgi:Iron/manganese superoxide dismutases, alpha-hairpin domain
MSDNKFYSLPELPYEYNALVPYISEAQLRLHHDKHHAAYVNGANAIFERLDKARQAGTEVDMKATAKELSFQAGPYTSPPLLEKPCPGQQGRQRAGRCSGRHPEERVRVLRAFQEGVFCGSGQCRRIGLGGPCPVRYDRAAPYHADRKTQCECISSYSHYHGPGCLGTCLLSGLQK